ncbi:GPR endopeptidase [Haloplasma contractile]|uniref:Germination protease protein n=1 Tax=Haloplasma contractile SSD-17B TaxID=1033810 RepID=U2EFN0_9MOLU|nr:GPR endopeptidase [Haloplasma contractile]ERJ13738.1 Germination protease protein [Haloplasma contractile SSD-17B]
MDKIKVRTDLIIESLEASGDTIHMNELQHTEELVHGMKINQVIINDEHGREIGKRAGTYVTIDTSAVNDHDHEQLLKIQKQIAIEIDKLLTKNQITEDSVGMIVGLGNDNVTPDSLGPNVIEQVFVTKHLFELHPESIDPKGFRPVCAMAPGVMGMTGIETAEIIDSVIDRIKPDFVIVVDALAAKSIKRVNTTIQLSDAGINPGSGVGNKRKELSKATLDIPVVTIGIPTVVDAVTITSETIDMIIKHIGHSLKNNRPSNRLVTSATPNKVDFSEQDVPDENVVRDLFGNIGLMSVEEKERLIFEVLTPQGLNMMVTPKEVDTNIVDLSHIVARGINLALHKNIN